jgi:hypothetical protein
MSGSDNRQSISVRNGCSSLPLICLICCQVAGVNEGQGRIILFPALSFLRIASPLEKLFCQISSNWWRRWWCLYVYLYVTFTWVFLRKNIRRHRTYLYVLWRRLYIWMTDDDDSCTFIFTLRTLSEFSSGKMYGVIEITCTFFDGVYIFGCHKEN